MTKVEKRIAEIKIDEEAKRQILLDEKRKEDAMSNLLATLSENEVMNLLKLYNLKELVPLIEINYSFRKISVLLSKGDKTYRFDFNSPTNEKENEFVLKNFRKFLIEKKLVNIMGFFSHILV